MGGGSTAGLFIPAQVAYFLKDPSSSPPLLPPTTSDNGEFFKRGNTPPLIVSVIGVPLQLLLQFGRSIYRSLPIPQGKRQVNREGSLCEIKQTESRDGEERVSRREQVKRQINISREIEDTFWLEKRRRGTRQQTSLFPLTLVPPK